MKKLFFLATCMLFSFYIQAQDDSAAALKALDSLLIDVDQSSVKTGIIYKRTHFLKLFSIRNITTKALILLI
jgi:hypothetical protein